MEKRISELFGNEAFMEKFNALDNIEAVKALFQEHGVELSDEELKALIDEAVAKNADAEFSAEDLDNVSGGVIGTLGVILAGSWSLAVKTFGSPEAAVKAIGIYWARKLGYRG